MELNNFCPECGASWPEGGTCQDYFSQLEAWEFENPADRYAVHHLMVLCYHLQHPSLYAPDGLRYAKQLLVDFVEGGISPQEMRERSRDKVDSGKRSWKIKAKPGLIGSYAHPIHWQMTAADVVANGADSYCDSVRAWARLVLEDIRATENLSDEDHESKRIGK